MTVSPSKTTLGKNCHLPWLTLIWYSISPQQKVTETVLFNVFDYLLRRYNNLYMLFWKPVLKSTIDHFVSISDEQTQQCWAAEAYEGAWSMVHEGKPITTRLGSFTVTLPYFFDPPPLLTFCLGLYVRVVKTSFIDML